MSTHQSEQLQPALERAKATLKTALDTACTTNVERADTGELIRIEEMLAIANEAAKEAISVRRQMTREPEAAAPHDAPIASEPASREIADDTGVRWTVFEVHPSGATGRPSVRERFRNGWLAFDCGPETRRLAPIPHEWQDLSDSALLQLCRGAEPAARRTP